MEMMLLVRLLALLMLLPVICMGDYRHEQPAVWEEPADPDDGTDQMDMASASVRPSVRDVLHRRTQEEISATPPDPEASGSGVLYTSVAGGAITVLVVCAVICYADRRSMKRKYEIRALEAEQRGLASPGGADGGAGDHRQAYGGGFGQRDGSQDDAGPAYGSRDAGETGFSGALLDVDGEAFDDGVAPAKGLSGTKLSGDLEYLRNLPDLRMPRLPGIRAVVQIDGAEISFKPGEEAMRQATSGSVGRGVLDDMSSTAASAQTSDSDG